MWLSLTSSRWRHLSSVEFNQGVTKSQFVLHPSWNTLVIPNDDGILKTKIYRKPPHTDQYLNWDSIHHLENNRSVVCTLLRRAETVVSEPVDVRDEVNHIKKFLLVNRYEKCSFQIPKKKVMKEDNPIEGPTANKHLVCIP